MFMRMYGGHDKYTGHNIHTVPTQVVHQLVRGDVALEGLDVGLLIQRVVLHKLNCSRREVTTVNVEIQLLFQKGKCEVTNPTTNL